MDKSIHINNPMIDRRQELRREIDLGLFVWAIETQDRRFLQEVRARDISLSGALLSGFDNNLHCGDVVGILYLGKEARFRIVWVRCDEQGYKMQAAVRRLDPDPCPWQELLLDTGLAKSAAAN
jgi:hypothetical protein